MEANLIQQIPAKHPKGVFPLFFIQLLGMIGFSMIYSLIVLYATHKLGFTDNSAYTICAAFNALAFATSVPGGYLAEKYLGFNYATMLSIIIGSLGLFLIAIPSITTLYIGLGFFIMGTGMIIPCLYVLLGGLYEKNDTRRENGFVLSYIGMNAGSFLASAISGSVAQSAGYPIAFLIGAATTLLMIPIFLLYKSVWQKTAPEKSKAHGLIYTGLFIIIIILLIKFAAICNALLLLLGVVSVIFVIKVALTEQEDARNKLLIFILLICISTVFWTLYSLAPSALTIFTERNIDRHFMHWLIPTANLSCLNPFFIITIGPLLRYLWLLLKKWHITITTPMKFGLGILLMGIGYEVLVAGIYGHNAAGYIALFWLVFSYFLQTVGELLVGPIGYAMVGELSPAKKEGIMMGIWQLSCGVAGALSEYLAKFTSTGNHITNPLVTNATYSHAFGLFGSITIAVGIFTIVIAPLLHKIMLGTKQTTIKLQEVIPVT